jgi:hypothetical protein
MTYPKVLTRLTMEQVEEIRRDYIHGKGGNCMELAKKYGISQDYLRSVAKGRKNPIVS